MIEDSMRIERLEDSDEKCTLKVLDDIDIFNGAQLKNAIDKCIEENKINIILNLDNVNFIDSSGMGIIIAEASYLEELGGNLTIKCSNPELKRVFVVTRFIDYFNVIE
jgi:anti-sigma B factor antagonist